MTSPMLTTAAVVMMAAVVAPATAQHYKCFDNGEIALVAIPDGGVLEPPIPLYLGGVRVNNPDTAGQDAYTILDFYDRVPGTHSYPLSAADIIANGYIRPLVQRGDGITSSIGTSVITGPSFRAQDRPLDLIPEMHRADITIGDPDSEGRVTVVGLGDYGGDASLVCARGWPDPRIGRTDAVITFEWRADADIALPDGPDGRGFDAFRLCTLSSMLAGLQQAQYDARYIQVVDPLGRRKTLELRDNPRPRYLYPAARPVAVGGSFALLKDNSSTWNPGSPSIEVLLESVSATVGALGVQGYLADTIDPNDDSLSVWLEWLDAPPTIPAGTTIRVRLRVIATPATDPGDLNHDGAFTRIDGVRLFTHLGRGEGHPEFDAYADLDRNRLIEDADFDALVARLGHHPADINRDGAVNALDILAYLDEFSAGASSADLNEDGAINALDLLLYLNLFAYAL